MRCEKCDVDLPQEYTKCPLCGEDAVDREPLLKDIQTALYPKYKEPKKPVVKHDFPVKYLLRFIFAACIILGITALAGKINILWETVIPLLLAVGSLSAFVQGVGEKTRMLHGGIMLLTSIFVSGTFTIISLFVPFDTKFMALSFLLGVLLFVVLFALKPKKMIYQLQATFRF